MQSLAVQVVVVASLLTTAWQSLEAESLPPADLAIEDVIESLIDAGLRQGGVAPAPLADDANFIRRVTLDLAGRIPASVEVEAYCRSSEPDKRARLVDRLLASPDYACHLRNEFDTLLMGGKGNQEWREWLLKAFEENRPWPQLFREMMLAREDDPGQKHALAFLKARAASVDDLTNDTSKVFFGVSINCARCHDHPLVVDWTQDHYFGMASFFSRTYLTKKNFLAERGAGALRFQSTAGEDKPAALMFLTGVQVPDPTLGDRTDEQKKAEEEKQKIDNDKETPPEPPAFSRRVQLVEIATRPDAGGFFSQAFVNRTWARLMGTGLVVPLDQMHSANKPSHPELLAWLARDIESHNYDLKRLMRGIVLSRAYGRSSRWDDARERPSDRLFAVAGVRPLSPMQYSLSLTIATSNPLELAELLSKPDQWAGRRRELDNQAFGFARQIEIPGENFQVSVSEALLMSNNSKIVDEYLRDSGDRLLAGLRAISDRTQLVQTAFMAVYSRSAQPEEVDAILGYLASREDRIVPALQQTLWSLVTSGEFRFNY
ncbi:MAG: DUF1549 domain-containing protein [Planctomycetaceae bacterium]|nr:DUF1549 domain-containing protein [Planctomycetaceae bacterium]